MTGTGVDVFIDKKPYWSNGGYSVVEDSTPVDPADTTGGFGQISTTLYDKEATPTLLGKPLDLSDGQQGETTGVVRGLSGNGLSASVTADSRLALTAVTRQAQPFVGTLGGALRYYLSLCGITTGIVIHSALETLPVRLLGWNAVVYDQLKRLAPVHRFEMSLVSNNVVFRPVRGRVAVNYRNTAPPTWTLDETNLAQAVEGYSYGIRSATDLAYPPGGWSEEVTVYIVEAGQTVELDLPLEASLSSITQPTCVSFVDRNHRSSSVYAVAGNDGIPIQPAQWVAGGGSVKVAIGEDTRSLKVTIKAASETRYAPYRIAVSSGPSDWYSSLRIRGTGVFFDKKKMTLPACQDADRAPQAIGVTVDNEFFETEESLFHALMWSAARYSSARQTISVTSKGIHRRGESGSERYPTIGDVEARFGAATVATRYSQLGPTVADWNRLLFASVRDDFDNQAFGNVSGARVLEKGCWYRIRTATLTPDSITYQAEWDNTIADATKAGETVAQWNARWAGKTVNDYNLAPVP